MLLNLAPPGGWKERAVICFYLDGKVPFINLKQVEKLVLAHSIKCPQIANFRSTSGGL